MDSVKKTNQKLSYFLLILINTQLIWSHSTFDQTFFHNSRKILHDNGFGWDNISCFNTYGIINNYNQDKVYFGNKIKLLSNNNKFLLNLSSEAHLTNHLYGYIKLDLNDENKPVINKNNFRNNVKDYVLSGFGYRNKWFQVQIGKGKESWGSGINMSLALSDNSNSYDYLMLGSDYGKIRVKYIHGFLEKRNEINRYINGRGVEWTNHKSLNIGLSEIVIYSGENRSLDFAYINPIASHLELELNDRLNIIGDANANAVWQIHIDYLLNQKFRISFNYLLDEFVLDPNIEIGKEHGRAHSFRFSIPLSLEKYFCNLYIMNNIVGTQTFRHAFGDNNFIFNSRPIGWIYGSDGFENVIGISFCDPNKIIFESSVGIIKYGMETLLNRPYDPYYKYKNSFPSGVLTEIINFKSDLKWKYNSKLKYQLNIEWVIKYKNRSNYGNVVFGISITI